MTTLHMAIFVVSVALIGVSAALGDRGMWRKLLAVLAVMIGTTLTVTLMIRLVPGDPVDHILGDQAPDAARLLLAQDLGLVDANGQKTTFIAQYGNFVVGIFKGQLQSFRTRDNVFQMIAQRIGFTAILSAFALLLSLLLGPLFGLLAAYFKNRTVDRAVLVVAVLGLCVPRFVLGPILVLLFAIIWQIFPVSGVDAGLLSFFLPAISLAMAMAAIQARMLRASLLDVLSEDFIRTAKAKGLSNIRTFFRHALPNALLPLVTVVGLELGSLLTGTVVIEKIFNLPGLGLLLLESIQKLDFPLVQACVLTVAFVYVVVNLITDAAYYWLDPRMRSHKERS